MPRIAVVEDNEDSRVLLQAVLEPEFEVATYDTGARGLVGIRRSPPDVVLLDISMPGLDGTHVIRVLRAGVQTAGLPVVALTAHAMVGDRERYLRMGFDGYLAKPITDFELLRGEIECAILARAGRP